MARSDERANDPVKDAFDYRQRPRKFKKFWGDKPDAYWTLRDRAWRGHGKPSSFIGDD
jgi:hypothetical protein